MDKEFEVIKNAAKDTSADDEKNGESTEEAAKTLITLDDAKAIATKIAFKDGDTKLYSFSKAKLTREEGKSYYEIEFYTDTAEYEAEIDAYSGECLEFSVEIPDEDDDGDDD